jgi:hypothetical protein
VAHGLRELSCVRSSKLPRMADFALWAMACETAFWPAGTFLRAYQANRRAALESVIDTDPVAACVRAIMVERSTWIGTASDLLRAATELDGGDAISSNSTEWPRNPRSLAGRLRRAQTFLRALGIDIAFTREGRAGNRIITIVSRSSPQHRRSCLRRPASTCDELRHTREKNIFVRAADDADGSRLRNRGGIRRAVESPARRLSRSLFL